MAVEGIVVDFAVKKLTETAGLAVDQLKFLAYPAEGSVTWYNDTEQYVDVDTFDEKDAVRWIRYEERRIAPKQVVLLTARGQIIHIRVRQNGATYDCANSNLTYLTGETFIKKSTRLRC
jgi:hypothetical protein